jgi:hypothetical protein
MKSEDAGMKMKARGPVEGTGVQRDRRSGVTVPAGLKASGLWDNHNSRLLAVRTGVKGSGIWMNHNRPLLAVRAGVRAGGIWANHNRALFRGARAG